MQGNHKKQILLVGNPNVGKSTVFNALCNKKQKTGNYAGVTVASHSGFYTYKNEEVEVVDLPGSYSIYPSSEDEAIFSKFVMENQKDYAGVIYILEALSLKRGLLLFQQIQDLGIPMILVVNQIDQSERRGISIDIDKFSKTLGIKIIRTNAKEQIGIEELKEAVFQNNFVKISTQSFEIPSEHKDFIHKVASHKGIENEYKTWLTLSLGTDLGKINSVVEQINEPDSKSLVPKRLQVQETVRRYQNIDGILSNVISKKPQFKELLTEKLDKILVHKFWGYVVFMMILLVIFQSVFFLAEYPMNWIDEELARSAALVAWLRDQEREHQVITTVLELDTRTVSSAMSPRDRVAFFLRDEPDSVIRLRIAAEPFSTYPVCEGDIDHVVGYVDAKDLFQRVLNNQPISLADDSLVRKVLIVPDKLTLSEVLEQFRQVHEDFAVIVNEYSLVVGVVTLNDVMSTVMGDLVGGPSDEEQIVQRDENSWLIDGVTPVSDVVRVLDLDELPHAGEYETLAGFLMVMLRRVPRRTDSVSWSGFKFEVLDVDSYRIDQVMVSRLPSADSPAAPPSVG